MKYDCPCGHTIIDQTDNLPYKAAVMPDACTRDMWGGFDDALANDGHCTARERDQLWLKTFALDDALTAYQCVECGRIHLLKDRKLYSFSPDEAATPHNLLEVEKQED